MASLNLTSTPPAVLRVRTLVVAVERTGDDVALCRDAQLLDSATGGALGRALDALGAKGDLEATTLLPAPDGVNADRVLAVGVGERAGGARIGAEALRRAAGAAVRVAGGPSVGLALARTNHLSASDAVGGDDGDVLAVAEGAALAAYRFSRYKSAAEPPVTTIEIVGDTDDDAALARASVVAEAVHWVRDRVNTPPGDLTPPDFADLAQEVAAEAGLTVEVLDEAALTAGGYGGILGVGAGSVAPPRLVRLAWTHPEATRTLAFVGKGITFDSGGLSIKPAKSMEWMKADMAGAAAVVGAVAAVARLGLRVNVTAWTPLAENMPSGTATRPGDVLRMYGGKTVEVLNTDAEGRLVLADALVRAGEESPDAIVDVATLTGAQIVALGSRVAAVMANEEAWSAEVLAAAADAGEPMWPMPLPAELRASMDTEVADIANMGDRQGGMLVAGLFLQAFVPEGVPWAHLDIAGPSYNEGDPHGFTPKGGTGAAVRTLVRLAERFAG